jgi:hypothetical protein
LFPYEQVAGSTTGNAERAGLVARATFSCKGPFAPAAGLFVCFKQFALAGFQQFTPEKFSS